MTATAFPRYNLTNVPEALRQLANRIELGEIAAVNCVVCLTQENGEPKYAVFGPEPFSRMTALGLLEGIKFVMMNADE